MLSRSLSKIKKSKTLGEGVIMRRPVKDSPPVFIETRENVVLPKQKMIESHMVTEENFDYKTEAENNLDLFTKRRSLDSLYNSAYSISSKTYNPTYSPVSREILGSYTCNICLTNVAKQIVYMECGHFVHVECMGNFLLEQLKTEETTTSFIESQKCLTCNKFIPSEDIQCMLIKYMKKCKQELIDCEGVIEETERTVKELNKNIHIQVDYSTKLKSNRDSIQRMIMCIQ